MSPALPGGSGGDIGEGGKGSLPGGSEGNWLHLGESGSLGEVNEWVRRQNAEELVDRLGSLGGCASTTGYEAMTT